MLQRAKGRTQALALSHTLLLLRSNWSMSACSCLPLMTDKFPGNMRLLTEFSSSWLETVNLGHMK